LSPGARGHLVKDVLADELIFAIREVYRESGGFSLTVAAKLVDGYEQVRPMSETTLITGRVRTRAVLQHRYPSTVYALSVEKLDRERLFDVAAQPVAALGSAPSNAARAAKVAAATLKLAVDAGFFLQQKLSPRTRSC
jgi:hypothetical protein